MVHGAKLSREQFIGWLGRNFVPSPRVMSDNFERLGSDEVLILWESKPGDPSSEGLLPVLAVRSDSIKEFFAFTSAYVSTYQPFSAFFRVVSTDILPSFLFRHEMAPRRLPNSLVGVVIAEARLQAGDRSKRASQISIQAGLATISAPIIGALTVGLDRHYIYEVMRNWLETRRMLSLEPLRVDPDRIGQFWEIISFVYGSLPLEEAALDERRRLIVRFVSELLEAPDDFDPASWSLLVRDILPNKDVLLRMRESREDRVRAIDDVFAAIRGAKHVDIQVREVALGYLASRVAGGSMSYLDLLQPVEAEFPVATLWFGLFCSLRKDTDVLTIGDCLGRRISRHLTRGSDFFVPPAADIALEELSLVGRELKIRKEHQNALAVEIFPTITSVFGMPKDPGSDLREPLSSEAIGELRFLLDRAGKVIDSLADGQGPLFSDRVARSRYNPRQRRDR